MSSQHTRFEYWTSGFKLAKQAEGCSPNTIIDYNNALTHLTRWCDTSGKADPTSLTAADIRSFLGYLRTTPTARGVPLGPKSVRNAWIALRSFYRWLSDEASVPNPSLTVPGPKAPERVIEPLDRTEVAAILKACDYTAPATTENRSSFQMTRITGPRDKAMVFVLLDAGLRVTELCDLLVGDVDLTTGKIVIRSGKGGKGRVSYVGKLGRRVVWRYLSKYEDARPTDPLFITRAGCAMDRCEVAKLFARLGDRAGVSNFHPHRLRHTFATEFLRNGGNLLGLQRLLGHSSLLMVRRYAAIVEADLARAHETGSPADRWRL